MKFSTEVIQGIFLKRYKRFFADVELSNGEIVTAHCPNTGSMTGCAVAGFKAAISKSDNPKRKLKYTLEMVHNTKCWIGVNTHLANRIVEEAILLKDIPELQDFCELRREVKYGEKSRVDFLLENEQQKTYVEVKNVTLVNGMNYLFPDAVTTRGQKHLQELIQVVEEGHQAVMLFLIQRNDAGIFKPADDIDPEYGKLLRKAAEKGVEILPYRADVSPQEIKIVEKIDYEL